jgi:hypothetical protein
MIIGGFKQQNNNSAIVVIIVNLILPDSPSEYINSFHL